ncbi:MAG: glycosyltransferase [Actinobacteria bacterium]|nr:glycosyltransferase [Actinomycetota bacterium]
MLPYDFNTRGRKLAQALADAGPVAYLGLSSAGRLGLAVAAGESKHGAIAVRHVKTRRIWERRTLLASIYNLVLAYAISGVRLAWRTLATPAALVVVGNPALLPLAWLHKRKHGSRIQFDARERPGGIRTAGSLATWVSRIEPWMFRAMAPAVDLVTTVCNTHAAEYAAFGFRHVVVVRNVPALAPRRSRSQIGLPLRFAYVGSLYSGRGLESLLRAVAQANAQRMICRLDVTGFASDGYLGELKSLVTSLRVENAVAFRGPCSQSEVFARYFEADVACVLYEAVDAANNSLPNKLFESMAAGCAVLATNLPETAEVVRTARAGLAVDASPDSLAAAIRALASDLTQTAMFGRNARTAHEVELNWELEEAAYREAVDALRP